MNSHAGQGVDSDCECLHDLNNNCIPTHSHVMMLITKFDIAQKLESQMSLTCGCCLLVYSLRHPVTHATTIGMPHAACTTPDQHEPRTWNRIVLWFAQRQCHVLWCLGVRSQRWQKIHQVKAVSNVRARKKGVSVLPSGKEEPSVKREPKPTSPISHLSSESHHLHGFSLIPPMHTYLTSRNSSMP